MYRKFLAAIACVIATGAAAQTAQAQSIPLCKWEVKVQIEHWTSGNSYWSTEFESINEDEARLFYELMLDALEGGTLSGTLELSWQFIATDVKLEQRCVWPQWQPIGRMPYQNILPYYGGTFQRAR